MTERGGKTRKIEEEEEAEAEAEQNVLLRRFNETVVKAHIVWQEENRAGGEFVGVAPVVELPGVGVPMVKMAVFYRENFAVDAAPALPALMWIEQIDTRG